MIVSRSTLIVRSNRMATSAYLLKNPITVVIRQLDHYRLAQLPAGAVFEASGSKPDPNGMIDGTCQGDVVLIFSRDLEDRAEPLSTA
jgi:hypothetical protein